MNELIGRCIKNASIILLAVAVILSTFPAAWGYNAYAENGTGNDSASFKKIMDNKAPSNYVPDDLKNPYSNDKNKFTIIEDNELLLFRSFNVNETAKDEVKNIGTSTYNKFLNNKNGGNMKISDDLRSASTGWESFTDTVYDKGEKGVEDYARGLNSQHSIAFDPDGTGYRDHVAYVGFGGGGAVYVWVYNAVTDTYGSLQEVGQCNGVSDLGYFASRKYLSITAGDYNSDGRDTFVIYFPGEKGNYKLLEYSCNDTTVTNIDWNRSDLHPEYAKQTGLQNSSKWGDMLGCDLTTGDFDGDGIDDLGVISFVQKPSTGDLTESTPDLYTPYVTAAFGDTDVKSGTIMDSQVKQSIYARINDRKDGNVSVADSMRSPSISAGDVDGDGCDELIAGGYYSKVKTSEPGYSDTINYDKITAESIIVSRKSISGAGCTLSVNGWTNGVVDNHNESSYDNQLCVECAAINGKSSEEKVFINGTVYEVSGASFAAVYTPKYFSENDGHIYGGIEPKSGSIEAITGVFDGNDQGREQIMVCHYMNEYGTITNNDFYFGVNAIFGTDYDKNSNIAGSYSSTDFSSWAVQNKGDANNQRLSLCMAAVDRDHDSILGSFTGKDYTYTDPKVAAVLQAGPYFDEISQAGGYANSCETSYSISTGFSSGTSTGNSVSFGAGVAMEVEVSAGVSLSEEVRAGYSLDWNETFEDEVSKEYTSEWTTYGEDQVVISRIPVYIYNYKVYTEKMVSEDKAMSIAVPGQPVYYTLSIEDYNNFADEYNTRLEQAVAEYNSEIEAAGEGGKKLTSDNKLIRISKGNTGTENYMPADTAGQPENYWDSWAMAPGNTGTSLSLSPMALGYSSGNQSSTFDQSKSHTESTEISHGFSFECQAMFGGGLLGNEAKAGGYVSLDYLHSTGSFTTTTTGTSTSGTVENIDENALVAAGMSKDIVRSYGFTWEFGTWRAPLSENDANAMVKGEYTPFFGYIVRDITKPPKAPLNVSVENSDTDSMHELIVSWKKSSDPLVQGYNLYMNDGGEFVKLNTDLLSVDTEEYTVTGLESNTEYTFVLTCYGFLDQKKSTKGESSYSNEASGRTTRDAFTLSITADRGAAVTAAAAGKNVSSGEKVAEDEAVSIEVTARSGYTVTSVILKRTGMEDKNITSADGKFNFAMTSPSEVIVQTERIQKTGASVINFGSSVDENNEPLGTVAAFSEGEEFSTGAEIYSDSISFEAKPKEGYVLQKWVIKTAGMDDIEVKANGSLTYDFGPLAAEHEIIAVFVKSDDPSVNVMIQTNCGDNGAILVSDENGIELAKDENADAYIVNIGSKLSFKAVPEKGYKLSAWSGDLGALDNSTTEYSTAVYEDMSFGAAFYAPVKYKVTYAANDSSMGSVTGSVKSGTAVAARSDVKIGAAAKEGFRLSGWKITRGAEAEPIEFTAEKDGLVTDNEYKLSDISTNCTVTAVFTEIEKYSVTINQSGLGASDIYLAKADNTKVRSGDAVKYADSLVLNARAEKGSYLVKLTLNGKDAENGVGITAAGDIVIEAESALTAAVPKAVSGLTYNRAKQTGVKAAEGYTLTGNTGTNAGDYTAKAKLKAGYLWPDGSTADKTVSWSIAKAKQPVKVTVKAKTVKKSKIDGKYQKIKGAIKVTGARGKVTYTKLKTTGYGYKLCTISKKTAVITMKKHVCGNKVSYHGIKVRVKVSETANYKPYTKTVYVKLKMRPVTK